MTREEAIADIKNNIKPVVGGVSLDMAIEALENENAVINKVLEIIDNIIQTKPVLPQFEIFMVRDKVEALKEDKEE